MQTRRSLVLTLLVKKAVEEFDTYLLIVSLDFLAAQNS